MNKKLIFSVLMLILIFSAAVSAAEYCDSQQVLRALRKALYSYFNNPSTSTFTPAELKTLLLFYIGIQSGQITLECSDEVHGHVRDGDSLPDSIPQCADGTKYGECSSARPMYCVAGRLVPRCRFCGCPSDYSCDVNYYYNETGNRGQWGRCYTGKNVTCSVDADCGASGYVGNYHCFQGDVYKSYNKYTCSNPGELSSGCSNNTVHTIIDDCGANEYCVNGEAACRSNVSNYTCVDYDGGNNIFIASYAKKPSASGYQAQYDHCSSPGENSDIIEGICQDNEVRGYPHYCSAGTSCQETYNAEIGQNVGACVNVTQNLTCFDGTLNGQCSATKPYYCNATLNMIQPFCQKCGCDAGYTCNLTGRWGNCVASVPNLTCSDGTLYGVCSATKPYYCNNAGVLVLNCTACGCNSTSICNLTGNLCTEARCYYYSPANNIYPGQCSPSTATSCYSDGVYSYNCAQKYCASNGVFRDNCTKCGCPAGMTCLSNQSCITSGSTNVVYRDTFTDSDNVWLSAHTPEVGGAHYIKVNHYPADIGDREHKIMSNQMASTCQGVHEFPNTEYDLSAAGITLQPGYSFQAALYCPAILDWRYGGIKFEDANMVTAIKLVGCGNQNAIFISNGTSSIRFQEGWNGQKWTYWNITFVDETHFDASVYYNGFGGSLITDFKRLLFSYGLTLSSIKKIYWELQVDVKVDDVLLRSGSG